MEKENISKVKITKFFGGNFTNSKHLNGIKLEKGNWIFRFNFKFEDERANGYTYCRRFIVMKDYSKEKARTMVESMLDETLKEIGGQIDGYVIDSKGFNLSKTQEEFISHFDNNLDKHNEKFYEARVAA